MWTWVSPEKAGSGGISWAEFRSYDWVFMHRPCLDHHVGILQRAQDLGLKVLVDYDDWLFDIPVDNETHATYAHPNIRRNMEIILKNADAVTTSTRQLRGLLTQIRGQSDIVLCPNGMPIDWFDRWRKRYLKPRDPKIITVAWRGSKHHQMDLFHMRDAIVNTSKKFENLKFKFVGYLPWFLVRPVDNVFESELHIQDGDEWEMRPPTEVTQYFKNIIDISPDIIICPLANTMFNKAKSSIAWQEAMWAGARQVICPDWEEWRQPGAMNYIPNDQGSFEHVFTEAILKQQEMNYKEDGWVKIQDCYNLTKINVIRNLILRSPNVKAALQQAAKMEVNWYADSIKLDRERREVVNRSLPASPVSAGASSSARNVSAAATATSG